MGKISNLIPNLHINSGVTLCSRVLRLDANNTKRNQMAHTIGLEDVYVKELGIPSCQAFRKRCPVRLGVRDYFASGYPVSLRKHTLNNLPAPVETTRMRYFSKLLISGFMCSLKEKTVDILCFNRDRFPVTVQSFGPRTDGLENVEPHC